MRRASSRVSNFAARSPPLGKWRFYLLERPFDLPFEKSRVPSVINL